MASNVENYFYHGFFVFLLITVVTCSIIATRLMRSSFNNRSIYLFNLFFYLGVIGFAWLWIQDLLDLTPSFRSGVVIYMISMTLLQLSIYNHDEPSRFNKIIIAHGAIFSVTRDEVKSYSKDLYRELLSENSGADLMEAGYFMERIWRFMFASVRQSQ